MLTNKQIKEIFGDFDYVESRPKGAIKITGDWVKNNIVQVNLAPYIKDHDIHCGNRPWNGRMYVHKLIKKSLIGVFADLQKKDLIKYILTFDGSFVPRHLIWNPKKGLSLHSYGIAMDFNCAHNGYGVVPPKVGKIGSLRLLVPIFNEHGFVWGGNFKTPDGMHFQINIDTRPYQ